jgi:hypothetical protein
VLVLAIAGDAAAEPVPERAKRLFEEGRTLKDARDPRACDRFAESYALVAAAGTALNLAECMEAQGKYVRAVQLYAAAASEWEREPDRQKSAMLARERADALRSKVVEVVVTLDDPAQAGLTLMIGERRVTPAREIRDVFDPGEIQITAAAPGFRPFARTVRAVSGESVGVHIPTLPPFAEPTPVLGKRRPAYVGGSLAFAAVGLVTAGAGGVVFVDARHRQAAGDHDGAVARADIATAFGVAGLALVTTAVILWIKAPRTVKPTATGIAFAF